jgi:hypothetical protein
VKITGSNFVGVSAVRFGSAAAASFNVISETEIETVSPGGSGTVEVTVENAGGASPTSEADKFTYDVLPPPTVTSVGPDVGRTTGGSWVAITGGSFDVVSAVKFGASSATQFEVISENEIDALSPAGSGTVDVTVSTPAGTSATGPADQFTYEVVESPAGSTPGWLAPTSLAAGIPQNAAPEPTVATDGRGDTAAIWADCSFAKCESPQEPVRAAFRPAGGSWEAPVSVAGAGLDANGEPKVAFDQRGDAFALFVVYTYTGTSEVQKEHVAIQAAYRPAGGPWQKPMTLVEYPGVGIGPPPDLAVDPQGDAIVVWRVEEVIHSAYRPAGGNWQAPVSLSEAGSSGAEVIFDQLGNAYAGWSHKGTPEVAFRPAGGNWQAPEQIPGSEGYAHLAVDGLGDVYALLTHSQGLAVAYRPSGGSWGVPQLLVARKPSPQVWRLAVDPRGDALLVWSAGGEIEAATLPAGGHWRAPVILGKASSAGELQVALATQGTAVVVWQNGEGPILEAASRPAGGGWHTPVVVSGGVTSGADLPRLALDPYGNGAVVWEESPVSSTTWAIDVAPYDAGPQLESLSIPAMGIVAQPTSFSVSPLSVWSTLGETKWSFGDGSTASGTSATHTYTAPGSYEATVESEDALGQKTHASGTIAVAAALPTVTKVEPTQGPAAGGTTVTITGTNLSGASAVDFGALPAASYTVLSATEISARSPAHLAATVDVTVTTPGGTSATGPADRFTYETQFIHGEFSNWVLSGGLDIGKLNQEISLPEGARFNGIASINLETQSGPLSGTVTIPAFNAMLKILGVPATVGLELTQVGSIEGSIAASTAIPGDFSLSLPTKANIGFSSITIFGLKIATKCVTSEPLALNLLDTLPLEELLSTGAQFMGTTKFPTVKCEGTNGTLVSAILTSLFSGPSNPYSIAIAP